MLGVPENTEFGIGFVFYNGTKIPSQEPEVSGNIYAEEQQILYIENNGDIKNGFLTIKVW